MPRSVTLVHPQIASGRILKSVLNVADGTRLCSMATLGAKGTPYINTAFFALRRSTLTFYFLSDPNTVHGVNLGANSLAALTVFDSRQKWGESLAGLQLFGSADIVTHGEAAVAASLYRRRFPAYGRWFDSLDAKSRSEFQSRFYSFVPERLKLLDEGQFGEETFVECTIDRS